MKTITPYILTILSHGFLFAEGLPLNEERTKYEGPHHLVKLNEDQLEEVTVAGTLTLTRAQWQEARAKDPSTPKRIDEIYPCTYNDCACGMEDTTFGVWFKDGTVAIASYQRATPFAQMDDEEKKRISRDIYLNMDARGQFYEDGVLLPYSEVKARVSFEHPPASAENNYMGSTLGIHIPPTSKASDTALASRLKELQSLSKAAGRDFHVFWDMTGLEEPE
jgi:hypothetical protein